MAFGQVPNFRTVSYLPPHTRRQLLASRTRHRTLVWVGAPVQARGSPPPSPTLVLTSRGSPRLPAARHLRARGVHAPAGAAVVLALDGPEGTDTAGGRVMLLAPSPSSLAFLQAVAGLDERIRWRAAGALRKERPCASALLTPCSLPTPASTRQPAWLPTSRHVPPQGCQGQLHPAGALR